MPTPTQVSALLLADIRAGRYRTGDAMPTLDQLNELYFGHVGPGPGRTAYAPLIAAGMVEARQGRNGGHFCVSNTSNRGGVKSLDPISDALSQLRTDVEALANIELTLTEFYDLQQGTYFGASLHPSRIAAEDYGFEMLTRLGEAEGPAKGAVESAGYTTADGQFFGIRIHGISLGGDTKHNRLTF